MKNNKNNTNVNYYLNNNTVFATLYQLTLKACKLKKFPSGKFTGERNVWLELAYVWNDLFDGGSAIIFMDAIHRIMWGVPCEGSRPQYNKIVEIVMDALLSEGEAFETWDSYDTCDVAIELIGADMDSWMDSSYRYSIEHYHYVKDRMLCKIRYSKKKYKKRYEHVVDEVKSYEDAIKKLIPVVKTWNENYWLAEKHILDEINNRYGVDYRDDYIDYGRILMILTSREKKKSKYEIHEAWCASNIKQMPYSIAQVIWPQNTEDRIIKMMELASKKAVSSIEPGSKQARQLEEYIHPVGIFQYSELHKCWAMDLMRKWMDDKNRDEKSRKDIKRIVFDIMMRNK